jgi:predicted GNAT family acetyltransferase
MVEPTPAVEHNTARHRFEVVAASGVAELTYRWRDPKTLILVHTGVPKSMQGHGIAGALAKAALDYARAGSIRVVPECPYVQVYLKRHPEYSDLVAE